MEIRDFPKRICVELTNRCNLECTFCPRHLVEMKLGYMSWELFQKIVDEAEKHIPIAMTLFFRGESLLHPEFFRMVRYAKEKGIGPLQLASNGFLLNEATGSEIIASGLDFISFSLDTLNPDIYKKTRIHSDLSVAMGNVVRFAKKCQRLKRAGTTVPEIQVSSVDVEDYRKEQEEFISFWCQYADRVRIYEEHSSDGNLGSIQRFQDDGMLRKPCQKVYNDMIIYWDGSIGICNHDWNRKDYIGSAVDSTIQDIWTSQKYQEIRSRHLSGRFPKDDICKFCDHWRIDYLPSKMIGKLFAQ